MFRSQGTADWEVLHLQGILSFSELGAPGQPLSRKPTKTSKEHLESGKDELNHSYSDLGHCSQPPRSVEAEDLPVQFLISPR